MTTWWITLWFSSAGLLPSATFYDFQADTKRLFLKGHISAVMNSTTAVANYVSLLNDYESSLHPIWTPAQKRMFKVTEQNVVLNSSGAAIFIGSKFLAPLQWVILTSVDPTYGSPPLYDPVNAFDYTISNNSTTLVNWTTNMAKSKTKYRIYRGEEYELESRYSVTFRKKGISFTSGSNQTTTKRSD